MKKTKQVNVLKHFNDKYDSRVKEVMKTKKKFMDGGTAGVVSDYNQVKYGGQGANPGVGKSYMSPNPAPAFKKGGMKKYAYGGPNASSSTATTRNPEIPTNRSGYVASMEGRTGIQRAVDKARQVFGKGPKLRTSLKKGGSTKSKKK